MFHKSKKGVLVVYALLVMTGLTAAAITFAVITIIQLEQGSNLNRAIAAYYAGESAAEQAIYKIKSDQKNGLLDPPIAIEVLHKDLAASDPYDLVKDENDPDLTFEENNVTWYRNAHKELDSIDIDRVLTNTVVPIELFDASVPTSGTDIRCLELEWKTRDFAGTDLEVTWAAWTDNDFPNAELGGTTFSGDGDNVIINLLNPTYYESGPSEEHNNFRVRLKVLFGDIFNVHVRVKRAFNSLDLNCDQLPLENQYTTMPGFFIVDATATSGDNQQNVRMAVAQEDVVAPWWDFVLFVEGFTP
ncbi:MAG: hypothetical protein HN964_00250 [Candidatus Jacksonbacteria bacterium]|jgi:hypothetical protein|nr:hypothetical protein [Candidatus Jacksonbacteria bacterium]MBT7007872.1 hypothetical protein [Candidatus Jacksonbacteria bacterium]